MTRSTITIFGATGFIGSDIVRALAKQGYHLRIACRYPRRADFLKVNGDIGQVVPVACDFSDESLCDVIAGSSIVINATGILYESGRRTFMNTHRYLPEDIAKACKKNNVNQFIHISALGVDQTQSRYAKSKLAGEHAIQKAFDKCTILRPSIVFGAKDNFFNMFAGMAKILPFLPLIGGGKTLFQPVYVGDISNAVANAIKLKALGTYQLGGKDIASFEDLLVKMKSYTGQNPWLVPVPFWIAKIQAFFLQFLPKPLLTSDQLKSLQSDNIVDENAMTLSDLGVKPTSMDIILPTYLSHYS